MADESKKPDAPQAKPEPQAKGGPAPSVLTTKVSRFVVTTDDWGHLPRGRVLSLAQLHGPANVARLIEAGCIAEHEG